MQKRRDPSRRYKHPMNRVISHYFPVHNALGQKKIQKLDKSEPKKLRAHPNLLESADQG